MSVVYFATDGIAIKIGQSRDVETRLKALATGNSRPLQLIATVDGDTRHETQVHNELADYRLNGEWFEDCPEVRDAITQYQTSGIVITDDERAVVDEPRIVSECRDSGRRLVNICERAGASRMESYEIVAAKVGTNGTWLRKFLAGYEDVKEPRLSVGYALLSDAVLQKLGEESLAEIPTVVGGNEQ
jgi:hypothetical protein